MIDKFHSVIRRYSPFSFSTLKELPRPTLAFLLTPLFFAIIYTVAVKTFNCFSVTFVPLQGHLGAFLDSEQRSNPHQCKILILGSSINGFGFSTSLLEKNLDVPVGKSTLGNCWLWEAERILKKYPRETQHVKLVFLHFSSQMLESDLCEFGFQNGNTFQFLGDMSDTSLVNLRIMNSLGFPAACSEGNSKSLNWINSYLPDKYSIKYLLTFEKFKYWNAHEYCQENKPDHFVRLQNQLEEKTRNISGPPETEASMAKYSQETEEALWDFIEYCQSRGIFVVLNITPSWYGNYPYHMPEAENLGEPEKRFVDLCQRLNEHSNCRILHLRDFHEIDPDAIDREYMLDHIHMTPKGATVYTNWVTEQIFGDRKIMAAIYPPEKCKMILAQRKSQSPSNAPVKVAVPENRTIR